MTKNELIGRIAEKTGTDAKTAAAVVNAALEEITVCAGAGDKLQITGWGTFFCRETPARDGRNPATGEPMHIPAKRSLAFKAGSGTKNL